LNYKRTIKTLTLSTVNRVQ